MKQNNIFKQLLGLFWPMLIYYLIQFFCINTGYFFILLFCKIRGGEDAIASGNQLAMDNLLLLNMIASLAAIPIFIWMYAKERKITNLREKDYPIGLLVKFLWIVPFALFGMISANYVVSLLTVFMPDSMIDSYDSTKAAIDSAPGLVQVASSIIMAPLVEELIFRGVIYNRLKKMTTMKVAAVVSAILFGVYHLNWLQAPYAFMIGLLCVFLYEKYQTIFASIFFHGMANLFSLLSMIVLSGGGESTDSISKSQMVGGLAFLIWITGAIEVALGMIINHRVKIKEIKKNETINDYDSVL